MWFGTIQKSDRGTREPTAAHLRKFLIYSSLLSLICWKLKCQRNSTFALVHIAAHVEMGTGQLILPPQEVNCVLKIADVSQAQLGARLDYMRDSKEFNKVNRWAPFIPIDDDVIPQCNWNRQILSLVSNVQNRWELKPNETTQIEHVGFSAFSGCFLIFTIRGCFIVKQYKSVFSKKLFRNGIKW